MTDSENNLPGGVSPMNKIGDKNSSASTSEAAEILPAWLDETLPIPATKALVALNILVFLAMTVSTLLTNADSSANQREGILFFSTQTLAAWGANAAWNTILDKQYWRILTSTFVHMNALHLAMNVYVLWSFSSMVERLFGKWKFLTIYLLSALGSSICSLLFLNPESMSVGASGAIFGTFGALVAFFWTHRADFPKRFFRMYAKMFFVFVIYSLVSPFIFQDMDNAAHLGGFLVGLWTALCLLPPKPGTTQWRNMDFIRLAGLVGVIASGLVIVCTMDEKNQKVIGEHNYFQAVTLLKKDQPQKAMDYLNEALKMMPTNAAVYFDRAAAYGALKQFEASIADATSGLHYDPKSKRGYFERSAAYHNLGKENEAIADLDCLLELDPHSAQAYNNRAWSYNVLNEPNKAIADSTRAINIDRRGAYAYDTRGVAFCLKGMYRAALPDFQKFTQLRPKEGSVYYHRAFAYQKLGDESQSAQDLQTAKKSDYQLEPWEKKWLKDLLSTP